VVFHSKEGVAGNRVQLNLSLWLWLSLPPDEDWPRDFGRGTAAALHNRDRAPNRLICSACDAGPWKL
jgi:hypothetical protein